ncbi:DUF6140 family protein [uncultured Alistipes sp.]|uniref:DUF6140 family protein n=1 Tax=uncultured Alistipes sp. TaxID=538949 RepID=UPI00320A301C
MATWNIKTAVDILLKNGQKISKGTSVKVIGDHTNPMFSKGGREAVQNAFKSQYGVDVPSYKINRGNMK